MESMSSDNRSRWRTPKFRQEVAAKIEKELGKSSSGTTMLKNSLLKTEEYIFERSKTQEEYLAQAALIILHARKLKSECDEQMAKGTVKSLVPHGRRDNQLMGISAPAAGDMDLMALLILAALLFSIARLLIGVLR